MICLLRHVSRAFARRLGGNHIDSSLHLRVERMCRVRRADIAPHTRNAALLHTMTAAFLLRGLCYHDAGMDLLFRLDNLSTIRTAMCLLTCSCCAAFADISSHLALLPR